MDMDIDIEMHRDIGIDTDLHMDIDIAIDNNIDIDIDMSMDIDVDTDIDQRVNPRYLELTNSKLTARFVQRIWCWTQFHMAQLHTLHFLKFQKISSGSRSEK